MKVAILTDGIWPYVVGGMQKHSYYLCKNLLSKGVDVDLYYTNKGSNTPDNLESLFGHSGFGKFRSIFIPYPKSAYFPGHYLYELYKYSKSIFKVLRKNSASYDLIYTQGLSGWYSIIHKHKFTEKVKFLSNFHGLNMFQRVENIHAKFQQQLFRRATRKIILNADFVQSLGGNLTNLLLEQGVKMQNIMQIGAGIESTWISKSFHSSEKRTFAFIGRNDIVKGIRELNTALTRLIKEHDFTFHFIGPFCKKNHLFDSRIIYHDIIRDEDSIKTILDAVDFLVLPSYSEGMPTVILEAMARGCAIIATDVGAVSELVSDTNGMLIDPGNTDELLNALEMAIKMNQEKLDEMKSSSIQIVSNGFTWEILIDKMISFFLLKSVAVA